MLPQRILEVYLGTGTLLQTPSYLIALGLASSDRII